MAFPDRGAVTGAMVAGIAGLVWAQWAASGVSGAGSLAIRMAGVIGGVGIVLWSGRLLRLAPPITGPAARVGPTGRGGSMFSSPGYLVIVAVQVVAFAAGNQLLARTGHPEYTIAWVAAVVGAHFLALGRLFYPGFYRLGAAMIGAGSTGAAVGLAGGGAGIVKATCGLIAAGSLFVAGGWTLRRVHVLTRI